MRSRASESRRRTLTLAVGAMILWGCTDMPVNEGTTFVRADSADWLEPADLVIGLPGPGRSRAYPVSALSPIEVLNDTVDGAPVVVTWCPLSATGAVFGSRVGGEGRRFRFHPDLLHMNLLFEDVETESVWSQLAFRAVDGPEEGVSLVLLPTVQTTWERWRRMHPETTVLRPDWGRGRFSYRPPAEDSGTASRAERELVLVVLLGSEGRAYPFTDLSRAAGSIVDRVSGSPVTVHFESEGPTAFATTADGGLIASVVVYWKYLEDFFPHIEVWGP